jgi:glycosyltransferase involved in cell wall biosynthesis
MKKIILVGLVPPPFNGQSVAFGLLIDKMKALNMPIKVVDMSFGGEMDKGGRSSFHRMMDFVKVFRDLVRYAIGGNFVLYLQIAQSRRGFMRDMVMNRIAGFFGGKTVVHLHGGNYGGFYKEQPENVQRKINKELDSYSSIIILSDSLRDMFSFHKGLEGKLVSLPNGIGAAVDPVKPKLLPGKGTPVKLLYLSNMIESKGFMRVLEAVNILNEKGIPVEASFCGTFLSEHGGNDSNLEHKKAEFLIRSCNTTSKKPLSFWELLLVQKRKDYFKSLIFSYFQPITTMRASPFPSLKP